MKKSVTALAFAALLCVFYIDNPALHQPRIDGAVAEFVLPFRMMELYRQPADPFVAMPLHGLSIRRVADTWQAPRSGHRRHEGQDLFAPRGTPVYSATDGIVIRITDHTLGGNSVFVLGRGGRTYFYTHLDHYAAGLAVGNTVDTNTVIGYVGNTGNARTTPPHLHFGVYTEGGAIDPMPLLERGAAAARFAARNARST